MTFSWGTVRQWHWMSSAVCLVGMLLFAVTGITLNHAAEIPVEPEVVSHEGTVPEQLLRDWQPSAGETPQLPAAVLDWLAAEYGIHIPGGHAGEWDSGEFYLAMPRPGGDAWLALIPETGELIYESTDRGWIAYLNDLHKGRDSGAVWKWFLDIFAIACIVFCLTGFWLLWRQSSRRVSTWPVTALGVLIPLVIALVFIH
ncbi:PepSY-associated TM helix domain-containing protein [Microbulbifer halophilus]|uniref:PepSY-associated TM helix domain-containing protein n=1 Tax=Microbulbifer halophilus TaxID=453963 RepID=A0ABW5E7E7_9GAMM|nr:PepSY-associated TM helix domain-containing protein [Microbulbifer halophilus]MCW8125689.1 PepSY-associated TM helix domain-containing protein [Microbulbifer halophilus]